MSINFNDPVNAEASEFMKEMFGDAAAEDENTRLYNEMSQLDSRQMTELANIAKQPVSVEVNGMGEIKEMADGSKYEVTNRGWKKIQNSVQSEDG